MKISLFKRKLADGRLSLFIEYYRGSEVNKDGKRRHLRDYENLQMYLHAEPTNATEKNENKETLKLAENILSIRKTEYIQGRFDMKSTTKGKRTVLNLFAEMLDERAENFSKDNHSNWKSTFEHLKKCVSHNLTFDEVDEDFVKKVRHYFDKKAITKSELPLSQNSKYSYFNKFKACLRRAFDEGYVSVDYARKVKSFAMAESQREYLTYEELQSLVDAHCKYEVLKRAFLFSCLTGLRW